MMEHRTIIHRAQGKKSARVGLQGGTLANVDGPLGGTMRVYSSNAAAISCVSIAARMPHVQISSPRTLGEVAAARSVVGVRHLHRRRRVPAETNPPSAV